MPPIKPIAALLVLLAAVAAFVWRTSSSLPAAVASHFDAAGTANGFMARAVYVIVIMLVGVGVPLLIALLPFALTGRGAGGLNLPHREHWLAPERRERTIQYLRTQGVWFAALLAVFLAFVHWLVVEAHARQPPALSNAALLAALAMFFAALAVWLLLLWRRFRKPA